MLFLLTVNSLKHNRHFLARGLVQRNIASINNNQPLKTKQGSTAIYIGTFIAVLGVGWSIDRYLYAEALARTARLAYNAGLSILDYKLNFHPDSSPDQLHERVSKRISDTCLKNGGLYIKLGQSIAIQAAILPPSFKKAFETMFDAAKPLPFHDIQRVWNQEFPGGLDQYFDHFDRLPIASGSIAQVHRARLKGSGKLVAVKVQRPDIPIQIELDLFAYRTLLYVYEKVFDLPVYFIAHYVSDQIRKETDFICEARNSERTAQFFENDTLLRDNIYIPKVHWPLTTARILTTEFVEDGCRLTDAARLEEKQLKKKDVMDLAMKMFTQMLFSHGWLHCDLHPGNVLVFRRDGKPKLALIDHGLYIQLPEKFRRDYCELWRSLFVLDTASIDRIAQGWGIANSDLFASATLLRPFKTRRKQGPKLGADGQLAKQPTNTAYESSLKIKETMKTILENEALIPRELIFIVRSMRMMQGNNQVLGSPTNRINIMAHGAAAGMVINPSGRTTLLSAPVGLGGVVRQWVVEVVKLWKFRTMLVLVDVGFFLTQVRQWWIVHLGRSAAASGGGGAVSSLHTAREGFEDLLQRQLQDMAKEEFGVSLDDSAFMG